MPGLVVFMTFNFVLELVDHVHLQVHPRFHLRHLFLRLARLDAAHAGILVVQAVDIVSELGAFFLMLVQNRRVHSLGTS